jgi:hypothetical protein
MFWPSSQIAAPHGDGGERRDVARERAVGGDDEVEALQAVRRGEAVLAVVGEDLERGREAAGFAAPVLDERGGADDEAGAVFVAVLAQGFHERQGLDGLAEAHLVGQQAAEGVVMDVPQPGHADLLVECGASCPAPRGSGGLELERLRIAEERWLHVSGGRERGLQFLGDGVGAREVGVPDLQVEVSSTSRLASPVMRRWALRIDSISSGVMRRGPRSV